MNTAADGGVKRNPGRGFAGTKLLVGQLTNTFVRSYARSREAVVHPPFIRRIRPPLLTRAGKAATLDFMRLPTSPAGFPMAPSSEEWEALSPAERAEVVAALPGEVTDAEMSPPEGDRHFRAKIRTLDVLRRYFTRQRRRIYFAAELPIYYPAEPRFAPDLMAVLDVEDVERDKWVVSAEGRGARLGARGARRRGS